MLRFARTPAAAAVALLALLAPCSASAASAGAGVRGSVGGGAQGSASAGAAALLSSSELWSTIDVCSPRAEPNTVGIRGSMPGDASARDRMYMKFRLQYLTPQRRWVDIAGAASGFAPVGSGAAARQGGTSFELVPKRVAFTLRGVVDFQWRHASTLLLSASRVTSAGRRSLTGANPAGFSAASCVIR